MKIFYHICGCSLCCLAHCSDKIHQILVERLKTVQYFTEIVMACMHLLSGSNLPGTPLPVCVFSLR